MNIIKEFMRLLGSIFCGADLFILHMCKEDKVDFIKKELGIFIIASMTIYVTYGAYLWGIFVLLLYKMFLSNLNIVSKGNGAYSFLKWLIATILAIGIIVALIEQGIIIDVTSIYSFYGNISRIITSVIIIVSVLIFCYFPVRFTMNKDSLYAKLYNQYLASEQSKVETIFNEKTKKQNQIKNIQEAIDKVVEKEYVNRISAEVINSQMRVAKLVLEKWENEQKKKIETNIEDYINKLK